MLFAIANRRTSASSGFNLHKRTISLSASILLARASILFVANDYFIYLLRLCKRCEHEVKKAGSRTILYLCGRLLGLGDICFDVF